MTSPWDISSPEWIWEKLTLCIGQSKISLDYHRNCFITFTREIGWYEIRCNTPLWKQIKILKNKTMALLFICMVVHISDMFIPRQEKWAVWLIEKSDLTLSSYCFLFFLGFCGSRSEVLDKMIDLVSEPYLVHFRNTLG